MDCREWTSAFRIAALVAFAAAPASPVLAEAAGAYPEIEYASPDQSVWTTRVDAKGVPDNPLFRLAEALFARAGIPWHGRTYPSARMFKNLQDGSAQFSMLVRAPALQDCCLWSRMPVATVEISAYRIGQKPPIKTREDLGGRSVIVVRGYSYAGLRDFIADPKNRIASSEAPTHAAAFKMLAAGRADYVIDYAGPAAETLAAEPIADVRSDPLSRQDVHLVLSRTYPDAEKVMALLESIAEALEREGAVKLPSR